MADDDVTAKLPVELVQDICHRIPRDDLLSASLLSRRWRSIGLQDQRYYLLVKLTSFPDDKNAIARASEITLYATHRGFRIKMILAISSYRVDQGDLRKHVAVTGKILQSCLSNTVELDVCVTAEHFLNLVSSLRNRAPQLHRLRLAVWVFDQPFRPPDDGMLIPADIFAGEAPALTCVTLEDLGIGSQPIPAFRGVSRLNFNLSASCTGVSTISPSTMPKLRSLDIEIDNLEDMPSSPLFQVADITLSRLSLFDGYDVRLSDWISDEVFRTANTVVLSASYDSIDIERLAATGSESGALSLTMSLEPDDPNDNMQSTLYNENTHQSIALGCEYNESVFRRIVASNNIGARISRIRTDVECLPMALSCGRTMEMLVELEVCIKASWREWPAGCNEYREWQWVEGPDKTAWTVLCPHLEIVRVMAPQNAKACVNALMLRLLAAALHVQDRQTGRAVSLELDSVSIVDDGVTHIEPFDNVVLRSDGLYKPEEPWQKYRV